ncbi:MAG: hypothetical protein ABR520_05310 [Mycobacteriales bacterium]|nr:hypothetical protein [Frankia sp.]
MDAYVFAREATAEALQRAAEMVGEVPGLRVVLPLAGEFAAYVAVSDDDPAVCFRAIASLRELEGIRKTRAFVGWQPQADDPIVVIPPLPRPTFGPPLGEIVCFVTATCKPGAAADVYVSATRRHLVVAAAIVTARRSTVLVELSGDTDEVLSAAEEVLSIPGIVDAGTSVGVTALGTGLEKARKE